MRIPSFSLRTLLERDNLSYESRSLCKGKACLRHRDGKACAGPRAGMWLTVLHPRCLSQLWSALTRGGHTVAWLSWLVTWLWEMKCASKASEWKATEGCEPKRTCLSWYCMSSVSPRQLQGRRQRPNEAPNQLEWGPETCSMSRDPSVGEQGVHRFERRSV